MISAASAVGVELLHGDAVRPQVLSGWSVLGNLARRRDVVGGHAVPQHGQGAGSFEEGASHPRRLERKVGRISKVSGAVVPWVEEALGNFEGFPVHVTARDRPILFAKDLRVERPFDERTNLLRRGPQVPKVDGPTGRVLSQRLASEVHVHPAGERISDHEHRRGQKVRADEIVDSRFEIPVST